ncbi:MAG: hypothetical protein K2X47_02770 [Bdellovibrionales bacterium]|nr:hypothetical protein [Bdellovibrionales bacterium]
MKHLQLFFWAATVYLSFILVNIDFAQAHQRTYRFFFTFNPGEWSYNTATTHGYVFHKIEEGSGHDVIVPAEKVTVSVRVEELGGFREFAHFPIRADVMNLILKDRGFDGNIFSQTARNPIVAFDLFRLDITKKNARANDSPLSVEFVNEKVSDALANLENADFSLFPGRFLTREYFDYLENDGIKKLAELVATKSNRKLHIAYGDETPMPERPNLRNKIFLLDGSGTKYEIIFDDSIEVGARPVYIDGFKATTSSGTSSYIRGQCSEILESHLL